MVFFFVTHQWVCLDFFSTWSQLIAISWYGELLQWLPKQGYKQIVTIRIYDFTKKKEWNSPERVFIKENGNFKLRLGINKVHRNKL